MRTVQRYRAEGVGRVASGIKNLSAERFPSEGAPRIKRKSGARATFMNRAKLRSKKIADERAVSTSHLLCETNGHAEKTGETGTRVLRSARLDDITPANHLELWARSHVAGQGPDFRR